jgi:hypothetical protein
LTTAGNHVDCTVVVHASCATLDYSNREAFTQGKAPFGLIFIKV